jgi:hypothetical protein
MLARLGYALAWIGSIIGLTSVGLGVYIWLTPDLVTGNASPAGTGGFFVFLGVLAHLAGRSLRYILAEPREFFVFLGVLTHRIGRAIRYILAGRKS